MIETPKEWLESLFEFEYCAECGGDADDHEVCIVPGIGTYFARCLLESEIEKNHVASKIQDHSPRAKDDTSGSGVDKHQIPGDRS